MKYAILLPDASERGDFYVRKGASPEEDNPYVFIAPGRVLPNRSGTGFRNILPSEVHFFDSWQAASGWRRRRIAYQKSRGRRGADRLRPCHVEENRIAS